MLLSALRFSRSKTRPYTIVERLGRFAIAASLLAMIACSATTSRKRKPRSGPQQSNLAIDHIRDIARAGRLAAAREEARQLRVAMPQSESLQISEIMLLEVELSNDPEPSARLEAEFLKLAASHEDKRLAALCLALAARLPTASDQKRLNRTDRAIKLDSACSVAHMNRAESLDVLQERDEALKAWKLAAEGVYAPALALSGYARALAKRGRDRLAVTIYRRLATRNSNDFEASYNLGTILLTRLNESAEAYDWLTAALKRSPADFDVVFNLAVAAMRTGEIEEAQGLLGQAKHLRPNDPEVHFNMALLHADYRHDAEAAVQCFQTYLALGGPEKLRVNRWIKELQGATPRQRPEKRKER